MTKRNKKTLKRISKELKTDKLLFKEIVAFVIISLFLTIVIFYVYNNQKHTVSFDSNGGNVITSRKIVHNKKITNCDIPVREGYNFIGWYYEDELFTCDVKVTKDIVLEAKWEKNIDSTVTSIEFNYSEIKVKPNTRIKLVPIVESNGGNAKLYWSSSDTNVAEVDNEGLVNLKNEGTVEITVRADNDIIATQQIVVGADAKKIEKIILSDTLLQLEEGSVKQLSYTIEPIDATNKNVKWMSDNTNVVIVSKTGEVVAKEPGDAIVILSSMDGEIIAKCNVQVVTNK